MVDSLVDVLDALDSAIEALDGISDAMMYRRSADGGGFEYVIRSVADAHSDALRDAAAWLEQSMPDKAELQPHE